MYQTPTLISELNDYGGVLIVIVTIISSFAAAGRYLIMRPLMSEIEKRTTQIQPNANGGQSLKDLHGRVDRIERQLDLVIEHLIKDEDDPQD
jgi:hypothetical protein